MSNLNYDKTQDNATHDKSSSLECYLTKACMTYMQENFDDNCNELITLRWFRDNYVSKEDINHYYYVSPIIVDKINTDVDNYKVYKWIYEQIVQPCVIAIQNKNYDFAYNRIKNNILLLEVLLVKKPFTPSQQDSIKTLKKINNN